jgi:hypothetical protein
MELSKMEIEKYKYWILFFILFIALIWTIGKRREKEYFETDVINFTKLFLK